MHDTRVTMTDGQTYCAPLSVWRPREGWFSLFRVNPDIPEKILLDEVESAITEDQRCRIGLEGVGDEDELYRAIHDGWMPEDMARFSERGWEDTDHPVPEGVERYSTLREAEAAIPASQTIVRYNVEYMGLYFYGR